MRRLLVLAALYFAVPAHALTLRLTEDVEFSRAYSIGIGVTELSTGLSLGVNDLFDTDDIINPDASWIEFEPVGNFIPAAVVNATYLAYYPFGFEATIGPGSTPVGVHIERLEFLIAGNPIGMPIFDDPGLTKALGAETMDLVFEGRLSFAGETFPFAITSTFNCGSSWFGCISDGNLLASSSGPEIIWRSGNTALPCDDQGDSLCSGFVLRRYTQGVELRLSMHPQNNLSQLTFSRLVPEPTTALLVAAGLAGLAAAGRRRSLH